MPFTELDKTPALVLIDLQKGIVGRPAAHPVGEIVQRSAELARAFRKHGWPVVLVNVAGRPAGRTDAGFGNFAPPPDWTELVPELGAKPEDVRVTKQSFGAFIGTKLDSLLRERGVTQIFLAGVATSIGVESTARSAFDHGYNIVFVSDAMTDMDGENHRHAVEKMFPRMGEVTTTQEVLLRL